MNKARRKAVEQTMETLDDAMCRLEDLAGEELDALANLPESLQDSKQGERMEGFADDLQEASGDIQNTLDILQGIYDNK